MYGKRFTAMKEDVAKQLLNVNQTATAYINGELPEIYTLNYNALANTVDGVGGYSFNLIDRDTVKNLATTDKSLLPFRELDPAKDIPWNMKAINSEVLQGIVQGESIPDMSKRIFGEIMKTTKTDGLTDKEMGALLKRNRDASIRSARTIVTGAENKGRMDSYHRAEQDGIILEKEWLATTDSRTRDWHAELDGQTRPIDEPFENAIGKIMFPGDPSADGANVYNCRCTLVSKVKGFKKSQVEKAIEEQNKMTLPEKPIRPRKRDFNSDNAYQKAKKEYRLKKDAYDKQFDEIVQNTLNKKQVFKTKEEVVEWANKNGIIINKEVIETVDLRSFNEVKITLEEMFEKYPSIKSYTVEDVDGRMFKTSFNIGLTDDGLLSANGGFNFNKRLFADYEQGLRDGLEQIAEGWFVHGDGSFSGLVRHEYGHNVQSYIENAISQKYHQNVDDWKKHFKSLDEYKEAREVYQKERKQYESELIALANLEGASKYSQTNMNELFAEGFAEYTSGGKSEFGKAFGGFLERWLK